MVHYLYNSHCCPNNLIKETRALFRRIDHVAFIVKDREKSMAFYEGLLGFNKYFEHDVPVPSKETLRRKEIFLTS